MDAPSHSTAGNLLLLARQQAGLSQRELAERAGVTQSEIARIESGKREPSIPTIQRILAGAGLELRFRLMPRDDHDQVLNAREEHRSSAERAGEFARHRRNVAAVAANAKSR
jgi:transcriptional regulator with XRE-family HTH domain